MEAKIGLADILNLIPEFSGEKNEIEFVYFREGCRNALNVLENSNKDNLLLPFLKTKLKGNAYTSFGLKSTSYSSVSSFLKDVKELYAENCDEPTFWSIMMMETLQKRDESLQEYIAKFQEMLQCAILGIKYGEIKQISNPFYKRKGKEEEIKDIEDLAASQFIKNMLPGKTRADLHINSKRFASKNLFEIVCIAKKFDRVDEDIDPKMCEVCAASDHSESECPCVREGLEYLMNYGKHDTDDDDDTDNATKEVDCKITEQKPNASNNVHNNHQSQGRRRRKRAQGKKST